MVVVLAVECAPFHGVLPNAPLYMNVVPVVYRLAAGSRFAICARMGADPERTQIWRFPSVSLIWSALVESVDSRSIMSGMSVAPRSVGELIDDPGWMPSLVLLWIGLVGVPWALTSLQLFGDLDPVVAVGLVWLAAVAASALSGSDFWLRAGTLAAAISIGGAWFLAWLEEGLYPIAGLPLFGDWTSDRWWHFGGSFFVGLAGTVCINPPTPSAQMNRVGFVSLFAVVTLLIPWWWLPTSDVTEAVLFLTAGLAAVALADVVSAWMARIASTRDLAFLSVTLFAFVSSLFAAGVFWRVWNGNFTPFPFQEITTDFGKAATLGSVIMATVLASAVFLHRGGSKPTHSPHEDRSLKSAD